MEDFVSWLNGLVWSPILVVMLLGAGLFFTVSTRFVQLRHALEMVRLTFESKSSASGISSFQSLALSLGDKIGVGNIAGVATAIAYGGPGAVFWMWVTGFLGMATSFIETTLAQVYKSKQDGEYRGGTPYYIEKALKLRPLAIIFAVMTMITGAFLLPNVQVNAISASLNAAFSVNTHVTGLALMVVLALIIFGGIKRIARTAEYVVPFMAAGYILVGLMIMVVNAGEIPGLISLIISSAFGTNATFGGIIGAAIAWGVKRGAFSNGAGFGSETYAPAAAEVSHPAKQGLVQSFATFIDTLVVCSITAFMILITKSYNVIPGPGAPLANYLDGVEPGPLYTQAAIDSILPGWGSQILSIAILFFAFTSVMFYMYMADTGLAYIKRSFGITWKWPNIVLKLGFLAFVYLGSVTSASFAWSLGDLGYGAMAWINVVVIVLLTKPALKVLRDYEKQRTAGLDPVFDSAAAKIDGADFWTAKPASKPVDELRR